MSPEIFSILPLLIVVFFSIFLLVIDGIWNSKKFNFWFSLIAVVLSMVSVIVALEYQPQVIKIPSQELLTKGMISFAGYTYYFDLVFLLSAFLTFISGRYYIRREYLELNEFYSLVLIATFGMMVISHSNNLLLLFLGIETMSLSFYVLSAFFRNSMESVEAGVKYFLLGAFATGFFAYGVAFIFGGTKFIDYPSIASVIATNSFNPIFFSIGMALVLIGLSFKIAGFPFHQWAPDVYFGAPTIVSGFMSTAGKSAAVLAFLLIVKMFFYNDNASNGIFLNIKQNLQIILAVISATTMLIGNFIALVQKNVKRMLAYSSVAHAGYLLMGIVSNNPEGWNAIAYYVLSYLFMQFGAFAILSINERENGKFNSYEDYYGFSRKHPLIAAIFSIFMFSLAGIPPFAGFIGKYYLFVSAIKSGFLWLTIVAIISSIISMYYYIGLVLAMYFKELKGELSPEINFSFISIILCALGTIFFGIFPQIIMNFTKVLFS
ncbi:MAG: NADH-quinone oxidoreductase subunit N [Candidatus Kapaibacteriales bacterium]